MLRKFLSLTLIVFMYLTLTACSNHQSDLQFDITVDTTVDTTTGTVKSDSEIRTAKYDFEILEYPIVGRYSDGRLYVKMYYKMICVSGYDYYESGHSFGGARAWLVLPDGRKIAAANAIIDFPTQIDIKQGDVFQDYLVFSGLPDNFTAGGYDIIISEYDDYSGQGDYSRKQFQNVTVIFADATSQ